MMVAAPGVRETGFPTIFAGAEGRVVVGYIGEVNDVGDNNSTSGGVGWGGYMAIMTDAFSENPLITTVAVNQPGDPLDITSDCGNVRCRVFPSFIYIEIDDERSPWIAIPNNYAGFEEAIIGTLTEVPALYGDLAYLPVLPSGGNTTLLMG